MLDEKLLEVLTTPPDAALTLVTEGTDGAHLVNTWNSYVEADGDRLLIPAGGMRTTERNLAGNPKVMLSIANREVQGLTYRGTGFLVTGTAKMETEGPDFDRIRARFPWARAALVVTVTGALQTL